MSEPEAPRGVHLTADGVRTVELEVRFDGREDDGHARWVVQLPASVGRDILAGRASLGIDELPGRTSVVVDFDGPVHE